MTQVEQSPLTTVYFGHSCDFSSLEFFVKLNPIAKRIDDFDALGVEAKKFTIKLFRLLHVKNAKNGDNLVERDGHSFSLD